MMKKFILAIGAGISSIWNWLGRIILLFVKFFFWIWGAVLASILVGAIAFWLISLGIKAFDSTQFAQFVVMEMEMEMMGELPEMDISVTDVDFEILEE